MDSTRKKHWKALYFPAYTMAYKPLDVFSNCIRIEPKKRIKNLFSFFGMNLAECEY